MITKEKKSSLIFVIKDNANFNIHYKQKLNKLFKLRDFDFFYDKHFESTPNIYPKLISSY